MTFFSQIQREKAAGNAEKRARQMDQGPALFEADENEEVHFFFASL